MTDTAVATVEIAADTFTDGAVGLGTAIVHANTHVITPTGPLEEMLIRITNTEGSTNVVTILPGDNPPADAPLVPAAGLASGAITATSGINYIRLTSSRFLQNNGTVRITVESGMTGFILPMQISRK